MPSGTPLTPAQLDDLARLYAECGNASAVARATGVDVSTVTRALDRLGKQGRAKLQRDALASGLRAGREDLDEARAEIAKVLLKELRAGTIEPDHIQKLGATLVRMVAGMAQLDAREERRQQARLTRRKTRAETVALQVRIDELPPMEVLKAKLSPAQVVELVRGLTLEQLAAAEALTQPKEALSEKDG